MLKAIKDRLIIKPDKLKHGRIIFNDIKNNIVNKGVVQSIGEDVTWAKVGDKVLFHCFDELPLPQDDLVVIREKSLLGKIIK